MPANNNVPISGVYWTLVAADPGTLDIKIDIEGPIQWEVGGDAAGSSVAPFKGDYRVITSYGNIRGRRGRFNLFVPDSDDRDDVEVALLAAAFDHTVPYYTLSAVDGTKSFKIKFDPEKGLKDSYLSGHRVLEVNFVEVAGDVPSTALVVPVVGAVSVSGTPTTRSAGQTITVTWANILSPSPLDFIALFLKSNPAIDVSNQFGRINLTSQVASGSAPLVVSMSVAAGTHELRMVLAVGPKVVTGTTITVT